MSVNDERKLIIYVFLTDLVKALEGFCGAPVVTETGFWDANITDVPAGSGDHARIPVECVIGHVPERDQYFLTAVFSRRNTRRFCSCTEGTPSSSRFAGWYRRSEASVGSVPLVPASKTNPQKSFFASGGCLSIGLYSIESPSLDGVDLFVDGFRGK
jgi:hypothetical protein